MATILDRAYYKSKRNKNFLVLVNPNGGPGRARHIYESTCAPMLKMGRCHTTIIETTHRFHAQELARDMADILKFDAIICCSGDGTPHEVINGLAQRTKYKDAARALATLPLCQLPCGSGNSVAISLNGNNSATCASLGMVKGVPMAVDLMLVTQNNSKCLSFLTQAFGTIADADLGTEHLRWMGGTRFVYGTLKYTMQAKTYPCDVYVKYAEPTTTRQLKDHYNQHLQMHMDRFNECSSASAAPTITQSQEQEQEPSTPSSASASASATYSYSYNNDNDNDNNIDPITSIMTPQYGTINDPVPPNWTQLPDCDHLSLLYCGKMPWVSSDCLMFPATLPTDGTMDLFLTRTTNMNRLQALRMLTGFETGKHVYHDFVQYSKVLGYRLVPKKNIGHLSFDGERFPFEPFQVEVRPAVGCLLSNNGTWTLTGFGDK